MRVGSQIHPETIGVSRGGRIGGKYLTPVLLIDTVILPVSVSGNEDDPFHTYLADLIASARRFHLGVITFPLPY